MLRRLWKWIMSLFRFSLSNPGLIGSIGTVVPQPTSLLGVGSASTSLVDYPKIPDSTTGNKYVDSSVSSSGDGNSLATAYKTLQEGLAALSSGQTLIVKGGPYSVGSGITRSTSWASPTYIKAYGDETVILDGSSVPYDASILKFNGSVNEIWHGFHARNAQNGGNNNGQAVAFENNAHDCKLSRFWVSHCAKDGIWGYSAYNIQILDSAVWRLGDGTSTGTNVPDTFSFTGNVNSGLQGIRYVRCFSAHAGDDGFDMYRNQGAIAVDCASYRAGYYWNGNVAGDGNAFKMGSTEANTHSNSVIGCIAIGARNNGFDDNATDDNNTWLRNTAVDCVGDGFQVGSGLSATVNDNISIGNGQNYREWAAINDTFNTWNLGITDPQFANTTLHDYSLAAGSPAISAGISGGNIGASDIALAIYKEWRAKDLT